MPTVEVSIFDFDDPIYHRGSRVYPGPGYQPFREPGCFSVSRSPLAWTTMAHLNANDPIWEIVRQFGKPSFVVMEKTDPGLAGILSWAQNIGYLDADGRMTSTMYDSLGVGGVLAQAGVADEAAFIAWSMAHVEVDGVWFVTPAGSNFPNATRGGIFQSRIQNFSFSIVAPDLTSDPDSLPNKVRKISVKF